MANTSADERDETLTAGDDLEVRMYELGFHLDPELPQEEVKKAYQEIRSRIAALGTVVAEGEPTKVPLAYTISRSDTSGRRDFTSAYFCWIAYEVAGSVHEEIGQMARDEKRIIRFIDIRTTREASEHAAEMHELFAKHAAQEEMENEDADMAAPEEPAPVKEAE
jgi:ribosomal protein S6